MLEVSSHNPWVCVRSEPHRESFAEGNLSRVGFEVYCPRYERQISHSRRRQIVMRPLFPSYLFVYSSLGLDGMGSLRRTPGVRSLAARDLKSALVPDALISSLRASENHAGCVELSIDQFMRGQTVRVTAGPFADLEAVFVEKHDERRCRILLSLLGKQHSVLLPSHSLERAP